MAEGNTTASFTMSDIIGSDGSPKVFGLPPTFPHLADIGSKTWKSILTPMPILTLTPCVPFTKELSDADQELGKAVIDAWTATDGDLQGSTDPDEVLQQQLESVKTSLDNSMEGDKRAFILQHAGKEYFNSFNTIVARMGAHLGINSITNSDIATRHLGGIHYYAGTGTSFSESGSNDYSDSVFSSLSKSASNFATQFQAALNDIGLNPNITADEVEKKQASAMHSVMSGRGKQTLGKVQSVLKGDQVLFPKIWQDSSFSRSYSLEFNFETPYGDRYSIFRDVYVPFASLLAMILPRQTGLSTYSGPFMCKVECKGLFSIDTGAITGFTINKSKEHQTAYGATRKITVTLDIEDLYPALMNSPSYATLAGNFGLCQYIDNLSLVDVANQGEHISLGAKIRQSAYKMGMDIGSNQQSTLIDIQESLQRLDPFKGNTFNPF